MFGSDILGRIKANLTPSRSYLERRAANAVARSQCSMGVLERIKGNLRPSKEPTTTDPGMQTAVWGAYWKDLDDLCDFSNPVGPRSFMDPMDPTGLMNPASPTNPLFDQHSRPSWDP